MYERAEFTVTKKLGKNVAGVILSTDMEEMDDAEGNAFSNAVVREGVVAFVKGGLGYSGGGDDGLVVTK